MSIGLFAGVFLVALAAVYPQLRSRALHIKRLDVATDASLDATLAWPTTAVAAEAEVSSADMPRELVMAAATPASQEGDANGLSWLSRLSFARFRRTQDITLEQTADFDAVNAGETEPLALTVPPIELPAFPEASSHDDQHTEPLAPAMASLQDTAELFLPQLDTTDSTNGARPAMFAWFTKLFGSRKNDAHDLDAFSPVTAGVIPDLLSTIPELPLVDDVPAVVAETTAPQVVEQIVATVSYASDIGDDEDLATVKPLSALPASSLPDVDVLIASALPKKETHSAADVIATMATTEPEAVEPLIPSFLSVNDDEVEAFEADERARLDEETRLTAEYTSAAADATLRAEILAEELAEQERDRAYGKWAAEFVGDTDAYIDVDTRGRIVEDLLTFGDEGRDILQRIASEDPVYAQRAKELLAQVA